MWIERVIARAFGPLADETMELGEGMTVIGGPNEAGKTSWHAATRLALTGVRRGPGRTKEAASVIERHRPWDSPDRWEVEARVHLADGRAIDISQDLAGRVACRARDVVLGDNVSMEIINEGTPDATRWLGLDRESFASVAVVSQAQIMAVADSAAALQDDMQRAAATRGTDATAAEAIERLKAFRREAVGALRVGATGPLWTAMRGQEAADAALAEARRMHADYLDREARLEEASQAHLAAQAGLAAAEADIARREADEVAGRAARATVLAAAHPVAPAALATRDELADEVAAAIEAWRRRPAPIALQGPSAAELQAQLAALPAVAEGDRRPDRSVLDAARSLDLAEEALRLHRQVPPLEVGSPPLATGQARGRLPLLVAAAAAAVGLVLVALGQPLAGLGLVATALLAGAWMAYAGRSPSPGASVQPVAAWEARSAQLLDAAQRAGEGLRAALVARGADTEGDVRAAVLAYEAACAEREDLARAAAAADGLRRAIESRRPLRRVRLGRLRPRSPSTLRCERRPGRLAHPRTHRSNRSPPASSRGRASALSRPGPARSQFASGRSCRGCWPAGRWPSSTQMQPGEPRPPRPLRAPPSPRTWQQISTPARRWRPPARKPRTPRSPSTR